MEETESRMTWFPDLGRGTSGERKPTSLGQQSRVFLVFLSTIKEFFLSTR